ncbi:MAG: GAF domain-containing protein [Planctomycetota bacterium]
MSAAAAAARPWSSVERDLRGRLPARADRRERMRAFVAACWPHLAPTGVSWLGFYERDPSDPAALLLATREPRPACSPIGLHGACGQCLLSARSLVVRDVADLGPNYIACDPRDRSELVVPCLEATGQAWGVLDLDSHQVGSFGPGDAAELSRLLALAGLTA